MSSKIKMTPEMVKITIAAVCITGFLILLVTTQCNKKDNNQVVDDKQYLLVSEAIAPGGHFEYILLKSSCAQELNHFPRDLANFMGIKFAKDTDNDNNIDQIKENASKGSKFSFIKILFRESDYVKNQKVFDKYSSKLQELRLKHEDKIPVHCIIPK